MARIEATHIGWGFSLYRLCNAQVNSTSALTGWFDPQPAWAFAVLGETMIDLILHIEGVEYRLPFGLFPTTDNRESFRVGAMDAAIMITSKGASGYYSDECEVCGGRDGVHDQDCETIQPEEEEREFVDPAVEALNMGRFMRGGR
jgi:hypothetical protein